MHIREVLLTIAAIIFSINTVFANSENSIKIALIAEKTSDFDKYPLISMLEVELSQKEGLQLLERAAIDKILEEQKLSAAGLLDRNMTIKIGKLLRADAFIILSLENPVPERSGVNQVQDANDLIRVRVSETAHGLRLLDSFEQSNSKNPQDAVKGIIQKIESVLTKINQPDEKLIPIGIVDIHRVQLGERYKMLERTLPTLLSIRLSLEPQIIMLEREDLKILLDEKLMTEGEDTEFWSSAILIDGYIQPNNGQLELHLNLKQAPGDNIKSIIVPVEPNEAATAIDKASTEIIEKLQDSPPTTKWNLELEAEQFYKQGKMFFVHNRVQDAMPLFEIAYTLQTKNLYYIEALFVDEWTSRKNNWKPYYTDIELAEIVSNFVRLIQYEYENGFISANNIIKSQWPQQLGEGSDSTTIAYFFNSVSVSTEEIRMLNRKSRKTWIDTMDKALKQEQSRQRFDPQMGLQRQRAELAWLSTDDPD